MAVESNASSSSNSQENNDAANIIMSDSGVAHSSEFSNRARDFDLKHGLLPEEVAVHRLAMPHENPVEHSHYLHGHRDVAVESNASSSSTNSRENNGTTHAPPVKNMRPEEELRAKALAALKAARSSK